MLGETPPKAAFSGAIAFLTTLFCSFLSVCTAVVDEFLADLDKKQRKSELKIVSQIDAYCARDDLDSRRRKMV